MPDLTSQVLAFSVWRLRRDMLACFRHPVLLAGTFVDPSCYRGSCYLAARWEEAGKPKAVPLQSVAESAAGYLTRLGDPDVCGLAPVLAQPPAPVGLRSLLEHLEKVSGFRSACGIRHSLSTMIAIAVASRMTGTNRPTAMAEFVALIAQRQQAVVPALSSAPKKEHLVPSRDNLYRIPVGFDPHSTDQALRNFATARCPPGSVIAVDSKAAPTPGATEPLGHHAGPRLVTSGDFQMFLCQTIGTG